MRTTLDKLETHLNPILSGVRPILGAAVIAALVSACSGSSSTSTPGTGGSSTGTAGTGGSSTGGTAAGGNSAGGNASGGNSVAGSSGGSSAGTTGTAGTGATGTAGSSGTVGTGGTSTGGSSAGTTGTAGTTGAAGRGGTTGTGGSNAGSGGATAGTGGRGGTTGTAGTTGAGGTTTGCPANATFCSGFEDANQPAGSVYNIQGAPGGSWTRDFAVDSAVKKNGNSSLRVKSGTESGTSGSAYKMLSVAGPAQGNAFWARFWFRSDIDLGGDHNPFAMACADDAADKTGCVEFAEDVGIAFNTNDVVRWPTGFGRLTNGSTNPYVLPKDTWYCIELSFDAGAMIQQAFLNGTQLINATAYPTTSLTLKTFKFGFWTIHGPNRQMWYDDVAVAPTRIGGCN